MTIFLLLLLIAGIILQSSVTSLPIVVILLLILIVLRGDSNVFIWAFFTGLILDVLTLHDVGESSAYFLVMLFLVLLYRRKYEIDSAPFIAISSFAGSSLYLLLEGYQDVVAQGLICAFFALIIFLLLRITKQVEKSLV